MLIEQEPIQKVFAGICLACAHDVANVHCQNVNVAGTVANIPPKQLLPGVNRYDSLPWINAREIFLPLFHPNLRDS